MTAIDKPVGHQFALNIRAAFKGNTFRDRQLLVDVVENNKEAPQFSKSLYYFLVFQFEKPGKTIGYLNATDESKEDYNRQITYEIQEQKYPILSLDKHSGRLRLNDTLRLDLKDINITVKVSDNGLPSKTAYALVKIKIVGLPELETFCTITKGKTSQICWQNPVHKLNYTYNIEIRNEKYHHRNTVSGGTEHCYNTPLRDSANDSYFYRVQSKFFSEISPYSQWRRAVHMRPDCDKFDQCLIRSPCAHGGTCVSKANNFTCHCTRGWRGETCENEDTCAHKVCLNNGTCKMTSHNEFKCKCPDGYVGEFCEFSNPCTSIPCQNGAACRIRSNATFQCDCSPGYSGEVCDSLDPCGLKPCKNGKCIAVTEKDFKCQCKSGYTGPLCDVFNFCSLHNPCHNNGTCIPTQKNSYKCKCPTKYRGRNCSYLDPCIAINCQNGGTCHISNITGKHCLCKPGFIGGECQRRDLCYLLKPCKNGGTCIMNDNDTYKCLCVNGSIGGQCQLWDPCISATCPSNKSTGCVRLSDIAYRCKCKAGYTGDLCDLDASGCQFSPCKNNGSCHLAFDTPAGYKCRCAGVYSGIHCDEWDPCMINSCYNGGTCLKLNGGSYTCSCPKGYVGKMCEIELACHKDICLNGGQCLVIYKQHVCVCLENFTGLYCQEEITCQNATCYNGGFCKNNGVCQCLPDFTGEHCETVNPCHSNPCLNGGTCRGTTDGGFNCTCMLSFEGNLCQKKLSVCVRLKPCNNRSVCTPTPSGGFICNCKPQFSGENCTEEVTCPEELQTDKSGKYNWPETTFNNTVDLPCSNDPADSQMTASRQCYFNTTLGKVVWLDMNTTLCLEIGREKASETLQGLQAIAEDPSALTADQVANLTEDLENIFTYSLEDVEMAATMTDVISNMLEVNATVLTSSNKRNKTSDRLRHLLEDYTAKAIVPKASIINISSSNINMMVRNISVLHGNLDSNQTYDYDPYFDQGTQAMPDNNMLKFRIPLSVLQPTDNVTKITNERVQLIAYNNAKFFMVENQAQLDYLDKQKVIYVKIKDRQLKNLTTPVSYMMSNVEPGKNNTCVFWNTLNSTWSTEGLTTKYIDPNITLCESTHLTSFSVLLNTSPGELSEIHQKILSYISYIGCIISIVGILLTIITYGLFGCLHGDHSGKILLNLCTSMLLLNSVFLVTSQVDSMKTEESAEALCFNLTILSHLFLLTTLAWMCVEAFNMYQLLVTVFSIYHSHFMLKRMFVAWGFPALIVAITLAVDLKNYKTPPEYCFLSHGNRTAFYAALLAPACIILSINSLVFAMVTKVIMKPKFKNKNQCNSPVTMVQVRGCFTVMVLLGVTWLFGPLAVNEIKLVFNYLFCILNSLQGFFIFVFRCLLNPEAKMAWIQLIKMGTLKKKKGPRKSVDSSSNGMYGGPLANRWSQKTMTIDIRESANLKRSVRSSNGSVIKNNPAKKYGSGDWEDKNGDAYQ
ncbi:adhesion G protein-coupled receptor E1-like [Octopus vulgaris]|nr:adhesion G protein-coupled receptor E1-like [Octopus vulgaris]